MSGKLFESDGLIGYYSWKTFAVSFGNLLVRVLVYDNSDHNVYMVKLLKLIGAAQCPWSFLNHNAKIQHSESAIHGFSRLLTDFHVFF